MQNFVGHVIPDQVSVTFFMAGSMAHSPTLTTASRSNYSIYLKGLPIDENYAKAIEVALLRRLMYQVRTPLPLPFFQPHLANKRRMRGRF